MSGSSDPAWTGMSVTAAKLPHVQEQPLGTVGEQGRQTECCASAGERHSSLHGSSHKQGVQGRHAGRAHFPSWQPN